MSDADAWVDRAVRGDAVAVEHLASVHRPVARRMARAVLGDDDAAEDVAQELLIRLTAALPGFRGDAELSTWVYRVTLNLCRDQLRRTRRRAGDVSLDEAASEPALTTRSDFGAEVDAARTRVAVREAVERLPEAQRELVLLRYVAGLPYREIARITGTPQGTVASRVFRALKSLGEDLEGRHLEVVT